MPVAWVAYPATLSVVCQEVGEGLADMEGKQSGYRQGGGYTFTRDDELLWPRLSAWQSPAGHCGDLSESSGEVTNIPVLTGELYSQPG